jgi:hypothetical protein
MPNIRMTVKYVNPPKAGKNRGSIKGADDSFLGVFADKLHLFEAGKTYDIEYLEQSVNGVVYKNVKSATAIEGGTTTAAASASIPRESNGGYGNVNKDEQIFVCALLKELIASGSIKYDKRELWEATNLLRGLWGATFGSTNTFVASEAGKVARR